MEKEEVKSLIQQLFEEEALVLGGLLATHDIEDDFVWRLVRNMDAIKERTLRRLESCQQIDQDPQGEDAQFEPHPAISEFLERLRRT